MEIGVGAEIGGYTLQDVLGQGGMGVVYLAKNEKTGLRCALKLLTPELARQSGFRERFAREARYANSIQHPNIIEVYDAGEADGVLYIAMQYVEGTDLKLLLSREGPLDPNRTLDILAQVGSALDAAHATGLLHRDVKPGNVMIASSAGDAGPQHCYLADFGLSKNVSSDSIALTAQGEFVGTIDYTAPELVLGKDFDSRLDEYSLACLFYECLTGQPPFPKERDVEVLYAHIQDPPPRLSEKRPDLPIALDDILAKAMAKAPDDRYATCSDFIEAARALVPPPPPPPPPPPGPPPAPEPAPAGSNPGPFPADVLTLQVVGGNAAGKTIVVEDEFLIGRQAPGDGKLGNDIEISRRHARITHEADGRFVIEDLGSTNGTYVNAERVTTLALAVNDAIELGDTKLLVLDPVAAPAPEPPPGPAPPVGVTTFAEVPPDLEEPVPVEDDAASEEPTADMTAEPVDVAIDTPGSRIALHISIDTATGEVEVEIDDPAGPARFVRRDGEWSLDG